MATVQPQPQQLFKDAPDKTAEALSTFVDITECIYHGKLLGRSGQKETMTCDCVEHWDNALARNLACDEDSNCINRLTSVECINRACLCGDDCSNQRFQKKQYSSVKVVQTEKKGYGLVAEKDIAANQFIYEYIGEVIDEHTFRERMVDYDARKLRHFYFMMLAKDAFIDATEKGCLARFCNHSCSPNAFVDKWVVGDRLRMGIFAKKAIAVGEEITFDYNVDRYGAQLQPCYCGLSNCLGWMGGKTQTDAALLLPDGLSEALGVTPAQERAWLKQNKQSKSTPTPTTESAVNETFVRSLSVGPLTETDVTKAMSALMKSEEPVIIEKLVERVFLTTEPLVNSSIVKLHGYKTLSRVLKENNANEDVVLKILLTLKRWPSVTKNKIELSQIEDIVKDIVKDLQNTEIKDLAQSLLNEWSKLEMAYRIPKNNDNNGAEEGNRGSISPLYGRNARSESPLKTGSTDKSFINGDDDEDLPEGWQKALDAATNTHYYYHVGLGISKWEKPTGIVPTGPKVKAKKEKTPRSRERVKASPGFSAAKEQEDLFRQQKQEQFNEVLEKEKLLQQLIQQSQQEAAEKKKLEEEARQEKIKKIKEKRRKQEEAASQARDRAKKSPEELWRSTLARYVPNLVKKHESEIGHDNVKGCARELVKVLSAKELKKDSLNKPPASLDGAKIKKLKEFCDAWMEKFLVKYRTKRLRTSMAGNGASSTKTNNEPVRLDSSCIPDS